METLLQDATAGDPISGLKWTHRSLRKLCKALGRQGIKVFDLTIAVTHFPPGASKWNPIDHRMFSLISANWSGEPLASYQTMLKYIRTTRSEKGFIVAPRSIERNTRPSDQPKNNDAPSA